MAQPTHPYGVAEVERLLGLPRGAIRAFVKAGFVTPARGARNAWRFSFQDLIVLRTAHALAEAKIPSRRITRSVRELRRQLPETMPLSGLSIGAVGDRVVVRQGANRWEPDSGQYLLAFEVTSDPLPGPLPRERVAFAPSPEAGGRSAPSASREGRRDPGSGEGLFAMAASIEEADPEAALHAYEEAIAANPGHVDARINLGRLLHVLGRKARAEKVYREAIVACGAQPLLVFNLAVLLDDAGRQREALALYEAATKLDPGLADAHYNLALLYEGAGRPREALRHMARYRALTRAG